MSSKKNLLSESEKELLMKVGGGTAAPHEPFGQICSALEEFHNRFSASESLW